MNNILKWSLLPVSLLIGTGAYFLRPVNIEREWNLSFAPLPRPNGYAVLLNSKEFFSPVYERVGDKFIYVDEIFGSVKPKNEDEKRRLYPTERKLKWIKANEKAFAASEGALKVPFVTPPESKWKDENEIYTLRHIANYWRVKAKAYAETGQSAKSIDTSIDILDLASRAKQNGGVITMLMGNAIEAGARDIMTREIAKLNAAEAAKAAKRLESIAKARQPLKTHFQVERANGVFKIYATFQEKLKEMQEAPLFAEDNEPKPQLPLKFKLWNTMANAQKRLVIGEYARSMDEVIEKSSQPWLTR
jgi:hypothetical protein